MQSAANHPLRNPDPLLGGNADDSQPPGSTPNGQTQESPLTTGADWSTTAPPNVDPSSSTELEAEEQLSPQETVERLQAAETLKQQGNDLYKAEQYEDAAGAYEQAIDRSPPGAVERAVYYANLAACHMKLSQFREAAENCSAALQVDPKYVKALMRRSIAFKELDDLDHALADAQELRRLEPSNQWAKDTVAKLEPEVTKRQEAMKSELFGKLKDLGNNILGKFGMSLDNFKADKDPATGSYSIRYEQ